MDRSRRISLYLPVWPDGGIKNKKENITKFTYVV